MIHVKKNGVTVATVSEGGKYRLEDGSIIMPVAAGWTNGEYSFETAPPPQSVPITLEQKRQLINEERDRRLAGDFEFGGKMYQRDPTSLSRITGAATLAGFAMAAGATVGDLRWANPNRDFGWIASDNTVTLMDAQTAFAFGQTAASVETAIVFAAKALREMDPIPENFTDDSWWV